MEYVQSTASEASEDLEVLEAREAAAKAAQAAAEAHLALVEARSRSARTSRASTRRSRNSRQETPRAAPPVALAAQPVPPDSVPVLDITEDWQLPLAAEGRGEADWYGMPEPQRRQRADRQPAAAMDPGDTVLDTDETKKESEHDLKNKDLELRYKKALDRISELERLNEPQPVVSHPEVMEKPPVDTDTSFATPPSAAASMHPPPGLEIIANRMKHDYKEKFLPKNLKQNATRSRSTSRTKVGNRGSSTMVETMTVKTTQSVSPPVPPPLPPPPGPPDAPDHGAGGKNAKARKSPGPPDGGPGPESSDSESGSSDTDDGKRRKRTKPYRVKGGELKLAPWPTTLQFPTWRRSLRAAVIGASDRPELATPWVFQVETPGSELLDFKSGPGDRMRTLDAKMAEALLKVARGEAARKIALETERAALRGEVLSGRQLLWLVYAEFRKDDSKTDHIAYGNLEKIAFSGTDSGLESFLNLWDSLLMSFRTQPSEDHLFAALYSRLRRVPGLATTVAHIDRLSYGHEEKSYSFLIDAARKLVDQRRTERQQAELVKVFQSGGAEIALPAANDVEKGQKPCFVMRDKGTCDKGAACPYSHDPKIIEKAKRAKAEGKGKGKGKGGGLKPTPKPAPKKICRFFNSAKGCSHGSQCTWLHERPAMAAPPVAAPPTAAPDKTPTATKDAGKGTKSPGPGP